MNAQVHSEMGGGFNPGFGVLRRPPLEGEFRILLFLLAVLIAILGCARKEADNDPRAALGGSEREAEAESSESLTEILRRVEELLDRGRPDEARELLNAAYEVDRPLSLVAIWRGSLALQVGEPERAYEDGIYVTMASVDDLRGYVLVVEAVSQMDNPSEEMLQAASLASDALEDRALGLVPTDER